LDEVGEKQLRFREGFVLSGYALYKPQVGGDHHFFRGVSFFQLPRKVFLCDLLSFSSYFGYPLGKGWFSPQMQSQIISCLFPSYPLLN